uniref:Uncharacterized protein n=1 Tax=Anopheles minimus TaxID=112268 RepID=A0A182WLB2_9DIPT
FCIAGLGIESFYKYAAKNRSFHFHHGFRLCRLPGPESTRATEGNVDEFPHQRLCGNSSARCVWKVSLRIVIPEIEPCRRRHLRNCLTALQQSEEQVPVPIVEWVRSAKQFVHVQPGMSSFGTAMSAKCILSGTTTSMRSKTDANVPTSSRYEENTSKQTG